MDSRSKFLEGLKVNRGENVRKNRYIYHGKSEDLAKKPELHKRVAALIIAGVIVATPVYKMMTKDNEMTSDQRQEYVLKEAKNIPKVLYKEKGKNLEFLLNEVLEYNSLDSKLLKNDQEKERYNKIQAYLATQEGFVQDTYLDLVKYSVAKETGVENYKDLKTVYSASSVGEENAYIVNKKDDSKNIKDYNIEAIKKIGNFQSISARVAGDTSDMAKNVADLSKNMFEFAKKLSKDKTKTNQQDREDEER